MIDTVLYGQDYPSNESTVAKPWLLTMNLKKKATNLSLSFLKVNQGLRGFALQLLRKMAFFYAGLLTGFVKIKIPYIF